MKRVYMYISATRINFVHLILTNISSLLDIFLNVATMRTTQSFAKKEQFSLFLLFLFSKNGKSLTINTWCQVVRPFNCSFYIITSIFYCLIVVFWIRWPEVVIINSWENWCMWLLDQDASALRGRLKQSWILSYMSQWISMYRTSLRYWANFSPNIGDS